ncbi:MAG: hypothetical protein LBG15_07305 [Dysgonamonadaceae bacterium]|jgi:hypothetical protein|nr:hypothetical protein [Dysgonamonadaceae bacterium]
MQPEITEQLSSWDEAIDKIISKINKESRKILIQSGHFSVLFNEKGKLVPAIREEIMDSRLKEFVENSDYMSDFPFTTFKQGMCLASILKKSKEVRFVFIVNDWQWVNKGLYSSKVNRREFFKSQILPETYRNIFEAYSFESKDIITANHYAESGIYFSEHKLKKSNKKKVSNCSPNSCAVEYIPFLNEILNQYDGFVSFIPMACKIPILYSAIDYIKSQNKRIDIFHIFYDPFNKKIELSFLNQDNISQDYIETINNKLHIMELLSQ